MIESMKTAWLAAVCAVAGFGCTSGSSTQILTGRVDTTGAVAIRAVSEGDVVTAAKVQGDGSFSLALPAGARYRLEVLTAGGVKPVLTHHTGGWQGLEFKVCVPTDPFDVGGIAASGGGMCDPSDPNCEPGCGGGPVPPPCTDPNGMCPPPPPPCDPTDPSCQPPCTDPNDPTCPPPPCTDPNGDPNGMCPPPWPCMDPSDPNCPPPPPPPCMDPSDPNCPPPPPPPCTDPSDPNCGPGPCMDPTDPSCQPPPPCGDPTDPGTCQDPCAMDPMQCGCPANEPNCWPEPEPPTCMPGGPCDPNGTMTPAHVPGDFGCMESFAK